MYKISPLPTSNQNTIEKKYTSKITTDAYKKWNVNTTIILKPCETYRVIGHYDIDHKKGVVLIEKQSWKSRKILERRSDVFYIIC